MGTLVNEKTSLYILFSMPIRSVIFYFPSACVLLWNYHLCHCALSSGKDTVFHYKDNVTPPKDYKEWGTLIYKLVQHWVDRYGISEVSNWFFEIWNEPNLSAFWKGIKADYFRLYQHAAHAIKKVDKTLHVGGPATAHNAWITDFLNFCKKNKVPADFISTHHYPTDDFGKPGDDTVTQLAKASEVY